MLPTLPMLNTDACENITFPQMYLWAVIQEAHQSVQMLEHCVWLSAKGIYTTAPYPESHSTTTFIGEHEKFHNVLTFL